MAAPLQYKVGCYSRLSREDGDKPESDSIYKRKGELNMSQNITHCLHQQQASVPLENQLQRG